jgi:hypothetical protein
VQQKHTLKLKALEYTTILTSAGQYIPEQKDIYNLY